MKNYFYVNEIIIKGGGMYVPPSDSKLSIKVFYLVYNAFCISFSCIAFVLSQILAIPQFRSDLVAFIRIFNMVVTDLLADAKICLWFYKRKEIAKIIDTLNRCAGIYEPFEDFVPERIIEKERRVKDAFALAFLTCGISVSVLSCIMSFKDLIVATSSERDWSRSLENLTLPSVSLIPFDHKKSAVHYGFAVFFQVFPLFNFAWSIIGFDSIYMAIISFTSAHLLIIQGAFRTLRERCLVRLGINICTEFLRNPPNVQRAMDEEIVKITKHLQTIMKTAEEIESLYNFVVLCQTMVSLGVLCTCLYVSSLVRGFNLKAAKELMYMSAICFQIFVYCYFGNKVRISSEDVPMGIFSMDWFATTSTFKRTMIINIIRMQRGVYFTIGKFTPLTLSTFVSILRGSYSFFAVLKNS